MQKADAAMAMDIRKQNAFWQEYKAKETARMAQETARGGPIEEPIPHPDDIIIDRENGPRFTGPVTEEDRSRLDRTIRLRDLLIAQGVLERRNFSGRATGAELLAMVLNHCIPPRLQLSSLDWFWKMTETERLTKPALLKLLRAEWRKLGHAVPRGFVFPDVEVMRRHTESHIAITNEILRLPRPDKMPWGERDRAATAIIQARLA